MSKEKKKSIILIAVLSVVCVILISFSIIDMLKKDGILKSEEVNEVMNDFYNYFDSKERKVIYYASSGCSYCELQTPILETIADDYDIDYLEIDSSTLGIKQREEILKKLGIEQATPTTIIVQGGKVIDVAEGYTEGRKYVEFFASNGIIPEDAVYSEESYLNFIDFEEYENLITKANKQVIVVGQTTCSHCIAIKPALNKVAKEYDVEINYLNITEMTSEESNEFTDSLKKIEYNDPDFVEDGSFGTPLTLIIESGKVVDYISGSRTKSQLVREFKKVGLIVE